MAEPTVVSNTPLTDYSVLVDELTDAAVGTGVVQYAKIMDGDVGGTSKVRVVDGAFQVSDQSVLSVLEEMMLAGRRVDGEEIETQSLTRDVDTISAALASDAIMDNHAPVTPQFTFANVAVSQTDQLLVACPRGKRIRVLVFRLHTGGTATNVTFNSRKPNSTGVACSETFATAANGGHHGAFCPVGHFQTQIDDDLSVTTGAGSTVGVGLVYAAV